MGQKVLWAERADRGAGGRGPRGQRRVTRFVPSSTWPTPMGSPAVVVRLPADGRRAGIVSAEPAPSPSRQSALAAADDRRSGCTGWPPRAALRSRRSPSPSGAPSASSGERRPKGCHPEFRSRHGASICKMVWVPSWHRPRRSSQARGRRLPPRRARTSLFADLGRRRGRGPRREVHVHRHAGRRVGPIRLGRHTTRGSRRRSISASSFRLPSKRQGLGAPSVPPRTWTGFASCARPRRCSHNQSGAGGCAP